MLNDHTSGVPLSGLDLEDFASGGRAGQSAASSGGYQVKTAGSTESGVKIYSSGTLVSSASNIKRAVLVSSRTDSMFVYNGGVVSAATVASTGIATVKSGGYIRNAFASSGGLIAVENGGYVENTSLGYHGILRVGHNTGGGNIYGIIAQGSGTIHVSQGGVAEYTTLLTRGALYISSGGIHKGLMLINSNAIVSAYEGSIIDFTISDVAPEGDYLINNIALIQGTPSYTVSLSDEQSMGTYNLAQGAADFLGSVTVVCGDVTYGSCTVNGATLTYGDYVYTLHQSSGNLLFTIGPVPVGSAVEIYSSGTLVYSADVVNGERILGGSNNSMHISSGGLAYSTTILSGGKVDVDYGGNASQALISGGQLFVLSGGSASEISGDGGVGLTVAPETDAQGFWNGSNFVMSNGRLTDFVMDSTLDFMQIVQGGNAARVTISNDATAWQYDGHLESSTVLSNGVLYTVGGTVNDIALSSGAIVNGFTIMEDQRLGTKVALSNTVVSSGITGLIHDDRSVKDTVVSAGATMYVYNGGVHRGELNIAADAVVEVMSGGVIDFTLTDRTVEDGYLINDLSLITGDVTYTVTVNVDQAFGTYRLAQGAAGFTGSVTLSAENTAFGTLVVNGESLEVGDYIYALSQTEGNLSFIISEVDRIPPDAPIAEADITAPTTYNVTVSATYSEDSVVREYSLDGQTWYAYTEGIVMESNGPVFFRGQDEAGNYSAVTRYDVNNIVGEDLVNIYSSSILTYSGAMASGTSLSPGSNNSMTVNSGGIVMATQVSSGAAVYMRAGAVHSGTLTIQAGATVHAAAGSIIYFSLNGRTAADDYLINNLALISGAPGYSFTVGEDQSYGTYKLAQGADSFGGMFAIGTDTTHYGVITVNGADLIHNGIVYSLDCAEGNLTLTLAEQIGLVNVYSSGSLVSCADVMTSEFIYGGSNNSMVILSGGIANATTVSSAGNVYVRSGGTANTTLLDAYGSMHISSGGVASDTTVRNWGGILYVSEGGTAVRTTVESSGGVQVYNGGILDGATVATGQIDVFQGGTADQVSVIDSLGFVNVYSGTLESSLITSSGKARIYEGGVGNNNRVEGSAFIFVSGGTVNSTTVINKGRLRVSSGGTANFTTVENGVLVVSSGGTANESIVDSTGYMYVENTGIANSTTVKNSNSFFYAHNGGSANATTVLTDGNFYVQSGYAEDTAVINGKMVVNSGGRAKATVLSSNGLLLVEEGGIHRGELTIYSTARVSAYGGGLIDFTVSERTVEDGYLINDLSLIFGTPGYTFTVIEDQAFGTYKLAQGAESFAGTFSIGTETDRYGAITVNGADLVYNGISFSLDLADGNLTLTVGEPDLTPPDAPIAEADITAPTTVQVVVSATYSEDSVVREYSLDGQTWYAYTEGIVMEQNGSVFFRGQDEAGNYSAVTRYDVANIVSEGLVNIYSSSILTYSGATVTGASLRSGENNSMHIKSGGIANSTTVYSGGVMYMSSGAVHSGTLAIYNGGIAYASSGSVIDFTLTGRTSSSGYVISNLDLIEGAPTFTLTVTADQAAGTYKLAQNVSDFAVTVTVKDDLGNIYGTIQANEASLFYNDRTYTLIHNGGNLTLTIVDTPPPPADAVKIYSSGTLTSSAGYVSGVYLSHYINNSMYISSGGVAVDTTIVSGGAAYVYSGGRTSGTIVSGGTFIASSGAEVYHTQIYTGGFTGSAGSILHYLTFHSGTNYYTGMLVYDIVIKPGAEFEVNGIGEVKGLIVSSGGVVNILSGGKVGGFMTLDSGSVVSASYGGIVDFTLVDRTEASGYVISNMSGIIGSPTYTITISADQADGVYQLTQGAEDFTGSVTVKCGNVTYGSVTVNGSGLVYGDTTYTLIKEGGNLTFSIVGPEPLPPQDIVQLFSSGTLVSSSHLMSGITLEGGGNNSIYVSNGGIVKETTVNAAGAIVLSSGGTAANTVINSSGALHVYSGGIASQTTVNRSGYLGIGGGATAYDTTIGYAGELTVWGGGVVNRNTIDTYGAIILSSGALADVTTVNSLGGLHVYSGAVASRTTIKEGGILGVGLGATVYETTLDSFGKATLWGGAVASNNNIGYAGELTVLSGAYADTNTIGTWGAVILSSGAVGNSTTILASGGYHIYNGAVAYTTAITSGANLGIGLGGTVYNLEVMTGANATFYDDSILRGWNDFAGTITVNEDVDATGSMINFDLTERTTSDGNIISNVAGVAGASYYVTVESSMSAGRYYLAGNAASIGSMTIVGTSNVLTTGGAGVTLSGNTYTLGLDDGNNLYLDVARAAGAAEDWDAMDLGTWDEVESGAAATLTDGANEQKENGFLAIA